MGKFKIEEKMFMFADLGATRELKRNKENAMCQHSTNL